MGRDKALLELAGKPLIAHAVIKLSRLCADVAILGANPALAPFAPLVPDLHPGCGPLGGLEAALTHSTRDWCLILPVDVPFLPTALLEAWMRDTLSHARSHETRLALFVVDGRPQPALLLIHRDLTSYVSAAIARDELKLFPLLSAAADDLASKRGLAPQNVLRKWLRHTAVAPTENPDLPYDAIPLEPWSASTSIQAEARHLDFANLNTPEDFAEAALHAAALDT